MLAVKVGELEFWLVREDREVRLFVIVEGKVEGLIRLVLFDVRKFFKVDRRGLFILSG